MENNVNAIFEGLNSEQKNAVACVEGPVLIVAGAGSGKTRVLTCRIANILAGGCEAERILSLTFTKKAAGEMKDRIAAMVGEKRARRLCMGTFHSVFIRFLRDYAQSLGYPQSFTIYDTSDSLSAVKACIKELQLDEKVYKPKEVLGRISMAKNNLVTPEAYKANQAALTNDTRAKRPRLCDIYALYSAKCKQAGVMDFDDILLNMNYLLRDNKQALEEISARFSYILVDEYQDTNFAQYLILNKLAKGHRNICVVGDDSQSIYAFRGAKIENILNFKKDYPECRVFRLERNYRSTPVIVKAANSLIAKNENRIPKECYAEGAEGEKIKLVKASNGQVEATLIACEIVDRMMADKAQYQDFAILYRTNSQSRELEDALRRRNIPYVVYSGHAFFDRAEIKDMMAYFKLVVNPNDEESFKRVVNKPARGIGDTTLEALGNAARTHGASLFKTVYADDLLEHGLKAAAVSKLRAFCDMISKLASGACDTDALELARRIADDSGLYAFLKSDTSIEGMSRTSNVEELVNSVASFVEDRNNEYIADVEAESEQEGVAPVVETPPVVTLSEYLENISLLSSVDMEDEEDINNKVALMTAHSAKGLEFPYVFVSGMEENLFPSGGMLALPTDIEEERRLFYVAMTRAKKVLTLSFAQERMRNGSHVCNPPSRFIKEIDARYVSNPLRDRDFDEEDSTDFRFGGFGSGFGSVQKTYGNGSKPASSYAYGRSSAVTYVKSGQRPTKPQEARPSTVQAAVKRPAPSAPSAPRYDDASFVPSPMKDFSVGQRVEHNRFGPGRILDITGSFPELKAKIAFDDYPEPKTILLKYAKMRPEKK